MKNRSTVAKNIENKRKERGFSISELARLSKVSRSSIGHYETGFRKPKIEQVQKIADALGVSVGEIDPYGIYEAGAEFETAVNEAAGIRYGEDDIWNDLARWCRDEKTSAKSKRHVLSAAEMGGFESKRLSGALSGLLGAE